MKVANSNNFTIERVREYFTKKTCFSTFKLAHTFMYPLNKKAKKAKEFY